MDSRSTRRTDEVPTGLYLTRGDGRLPNALVETHAGEAAEFYRELIRDRIVTINFMSLRNHAQYPATTHLSRIARALADELSRDVFMYSITTDPEHDTVDRLAAFAREHEVPRGWLFLRAAPNDVATISHRLYRHARRQGHPARLVHYGQGSIGVWGAFAADTRPGLAVERLRWLSPSQAPTSAEDRYGEPFADNRQLGDVGEPPQRERV
jgi:hypothetical protein